MSFKLNGKAVDVIVEPRELLIHTLRERLLHTGPHIGCETSHCGACTVDLDGMSVKSCTVLTVQCQDADVLTIEGFEQGGALHALQEGIHQQHGLQCGYCTPGMITRAYRLLKETPNPTEEEIRYWMAGNLCRCTGYQNIVKAVQNAAKKLAAAPACKQSRSIAENSSWLMSAETLEREEKLQGIGSFQIAQGRCALHSRQGTYVDDIKLPGMLFGAIVRSPYAHASIKSIDKSKALAVPGVVAVLVADDLKPVKLHWMPTLGGDVQAVLADGKVCFQMQEVAMVIASDRYSAADGARGRSRLRRAAGHRRSAQVHGGRCADHSPRYRRQGQRRPRHAHASQPYLHLGSGRQGRDRCGVCQGRSDGQGRNPQPARASLSAGDLRLRRLVQQAHGPVDGLHDVAGAASGAHRAGDAVRHCGKQDPHRRRRHRRRFRQQGADLSGLCRRHRGVDRDRRADQMDRVAHRKYFHHRFRARLSRHRRACGRQGRPHQGLRFTALADHGAFNSHVSATKLPAGLFSICTGSYDIPKAYCRVDAVYTNKAPGGVAYRCSLRVTEAVYLIERMIDVLAQKLNIDKAEIRRRNFVKEEQFPYTTAFGWTLDSGNYHPALEKVLKAVDYEGLRREQAEKRAKGELMGIGICTFTEIVGAGPTKVCDILGIGLFDSCEIRVNPTGSVIARLGTMSQGQGHATTYAQIIATELGLPSDDIQIEEGDTDKAPYGAGTWGSRSTPVAGAATAVARARSGRRRRRSPHTCWRSAKATSSGRSIASRSKATRARPRP